MTLNSQIDTIFNLIEASLNNFSEKNEEKTDINLKNSYDAIACLINAYMLKTGYKLLGFGENHCLDTPITESEMKPLSNIFNESSDPFYAFRYSFNSKEEIYLIKLLKMDKKIVILGTIMGKGNTITHDISVDDYTQKGVFPYSSKQKDRSLEEVYVSNEKIIELLKIYHSNFLEKLTPDLKEELNSRKNNLCEGHFFQIPKDNFSSRCMENSISYKFNVQERDNQTSNTCNISIGSDDLYPPGIGQHPLLTPCIIREPILDEIKDCNSGMYPSKTHPIFSGTKAKKNFQLPPGVRYDPISPNDGLGLGLGNLGNPSRKYRNIGEPDNDEFLPPDVDRMYI
ncbi:hypothetical protein PNEG_00325 [Pneumocystis murina B123]|uniref:Uncharacterized protein n=1 Tax=Pneumocystis murina (strain B123) TaxID=1069680 RepID=M7NW04_PNEMU|nr:hypothetical protein PNEG_00325 [Pneumocystis murina B123]EMR11296.1 hypothetical protein PNEG_00325 [Pneumocystis murina B123]